MDKKNHLLTPLLIAAAISVVFFAGIGVAAMTGHLSIMQLNPYPFADLVGSRSGSAPQPAAPASSLTKKGIDRPGSQAALKPIDFKPGTRVANRKAKCLDCGIVDSIRAREMDSKAIMAAGLSDQLQAEIVQADGRASTANPELRTADDTRMAVNFVMILRMEDGTLRTVYENQRPPFSIGERVRLVNGSVVPLG